MKDISLHVLDIAQNAIRAGASLVRIDVCEDRARDTLTVSIEDDGCGMDEELLRHVTDPFVTTRTTRRVGLGLPLFKAGAERSGGSFSIRSEVGIGTTVTAVYQLSHIDRPPLGDMAETVLTLAIGGETPEYLYTHRLINTEGTERAYAFDTRAVRDAAGGLPLNEPEIAAWMRDYLSLGIAELYGGALSI